MLSPLSSTECDWRLWTCRSSSGIGLACLILVFDTGTLVCAKLLATCFETCTCYTISCRLDTKIQLERCSQQQMEGSKWVCHGFVLAAGQQRPGSAYAFHLGPPEKGLLKQGAISMSTSNSECRVVDIIICHLRRYHSWLEDNVGRKGDSSSTVIIKGVIGVGSCSGGGL